MRYATPLVLAVLRRLQEPDAATDPSFFYLKARAFEAIAEDTPDLADEARQCAREAVRRAEELSA